MPKHIDEDVKGMTCPEDHLEHIQNLEKAQGALTAHIIGKLQELIEGHV